MTKANIPIGCIKQSIHQVSGGGLSHYSSLVRPQLEYSVQFWTHQCKRNPMDILGRAQWRDMKTEGLNHLSCEGKLRLFILEKILGGSYHRIIKTGRDHTPIMIKTEFFSKCLSWSSESREKNPNKPLAF